MYVIKKSKVCLIESHLIWTIDDFIRLFRIISIIEVIQNWKRKIKITLKPQIEQIAKNILAFKHQINVGKL